MKLNRYEKVSSYDQRIYIRSVQMAAGRVPWMGIGKACKDTSQAQICLPGFSFSKDEAFEKRREIEL